MNIAGRLRPSGFCEGILLKKQFVFRAAWAAAGLILGALLTLGAGMLLLGGGGELRSALKYAEVLRVIRENYVGDADLDDVTDGAAAGAVAGLEDRWSYYMTAEEYEEYQDYSANRYQGIGVTITKDEETGGFTVISVNRDGPAQQAGIVAGDILLAVDGVSVTGSETEDLRALIQADYGKEALLTVLHENGETEDLSVSCREIYSTPVTFRMLGEDTGYIRIDNFREGAGADAIDAVEDLMEEGAAALIFDVRNDPGGQLTELVRILDYLLPEGDVFIRTDKAGHETVEVSDGSSVERPMAVIVNGDSYSAAEFFAAALREYGAAAVVGEPTTGKSRSQVTIRLSDGSAVHLSKYSYLTPQRNDLYEAGGLKPDVELALTEEERTSFDTGWLEPEDDPQIQAALDLLHA